MKKKMLVTLNFHRIAPFQKGNDGTILVLQKGGTNGLV